MATNDRQQNNNPVNQSPNSGIPSSNHKMIYALLIAVIILLIAAVAYLVMDKKSEQTNNQQTNNTQPPAPNPAPTPNPNSTTNPTANWKTYSNTQRGFEIKYPSDWTYLAPENSTAAQLQYFRANDKNDEFKIEFAYKSYEGLVREKQVNSNFDGSVVKYNVYGYVKNLEGPASIDLNNPKRLASFKLNATQANKLQISGYGQGQDAAISEGEGAFIQMQYDKSDEDAALEIFNQILSSFQFTK